MRHGDIATGFDYSREGQWPLHHEPVAHPAFRQPQDAPVPGAAAFSVPAGKSASTPSRPIRMWSVSTLRITPSRPRAGISAAPSAAPQTPIWTRSSWMTPRIAHVRLFRYRQLCPARGRAGRHCRSQGGEIAVSLLDTNLDPVLSARQLTRRYGSRIGCKDVSLDVWPGEVLDRIVGESGSGKSTLLNMLSGRLEPSAGHVHYTAADGEVLDIHSLDEAQRRRLLRTELGFVHQHPRDGLRVSDQRRRGSRRASHGQRGPALRATWAGHGSGLAGTGGECPCSVWTIRRPSIPAACSSVCRSPAIW